MGMDSYCCFAASGKRQGVNLHAARGKSAPKTIVKMATANITAQMTCIFVDMDTVDGWPGSDRRAR